MKKRPHTTLFLIQSLDGKITTGDNDQMDSEDLHKISGIKEGMHQYYEFEKNLDGVYLNSGRVLAKVGFNEKVWEKEGNDGLSFAVVDNKPHLNNKGCEYLAKRTEKFYLISANRNHPAVSLKDQYPNIFPIIYEEKIDFIDAFEKLKQEHGVEEIIVQTGGTLNSIFLRSGLIDFVSIVIAPCLIGGKETQSLIGGKSLHVKEDLTKIKALKFRNCNIWGNSYIHLEYDVMNDTKVDD